MVVHEAGRIVNPVVADAQVVGGVGQGIGGILSEHLRYDANGTQLCVPLKKIEAFSYIHKLEQIANSLNCFLKD